MFRFADEGPKEKKQFKNIVRNVCNIHYVFTNF